MPLSAPGPQRLHEWEGARARRHRRSVRQPEQPGGPFQQAVAGTGDDVLTGLAVAAALAAPLNWRPQQLLRCLQPSAVSQTALSCLLDLQNIEDAAARLLAEECGTRGPPAGWNSR